MSLGAGIAAMENVQSFLEKYDETKTVYSVTSPNVQFLDQNVKIKSTWNISVAMTSWKILYYIMRANFDGLASDICAQPPKLVGHLGSATYEHGKEVTGVEYKDGLVTVEFRDMGTESHTTIHADLVIVADGSFSKVRQILQPNLQHKYAGYVAWRGTAPESEISEETKTIFACKTTFFAYKGGYIVLYVVFLIVKILQTNRVIVIPSQEKMETPPQAIGNLTGSGITHAPRTHKSISM